MADNTIPSSTGTSSSQRVFSIPPEVTEKYPDLVDLIKASSSMNDDERQYWFSILPIMTQDQVVRLREILTTEKQKLQEIDQKYQKQLEQINEKHLLEWQAVKLKERRTKVAAAEKKSKAQEKQEEEDLMQQLGDA